MNNNLIKNIKQFEQGQRNKEYYYVLSYVGHLGKIRKKYIQEKLKLVSTEDRLKSTKSKLIKKRYIRKREFLIKRLENLEKRLFNIVGKLAEKYFNFINWNVLKNKYIRDLIQKGYNVVNAKSHIFIVFVTNAEFMRFVLTEDIYSYTYRFVIECKEGFISENSRTNYYTLIQWTYLDGEMDRNVFFEVMLKLASKYKVLDGNTYTEFLVNEISKIYPLVISRYEKFLWENPTSIISDYWIHCDSIEMYKNR